MDMKRLSVIPALLLLSSCRPPAVEYGKPSIEIKTQVKSTPSDIPAIEGGFLHRTVTLSTQGPALVRERRVVARKAGWSRIEYAGVAETLEPASVQAGCGDCGMVLTEQNFAFDLIEPQRILRLSEGETITVFRTDPKTGEEKRIQGTILASNEGLVIKTETGVEPVLGSDRVSLEAMPERLIPEPSLSWIVYSRDEGRQEIEVSYLADGMSWKGEHLVYADFDSSTADVEFHAFLSNGTTLRMEKTRILLAEGGLASSPPIFAIDRPSDLDGNSSKRFLLAKADRVPFTLIEEAEIRLDAVPRAPVDVKTVLKFAHDGSSKLPFALPSGTVRVFHSGPDSEPLFLGEAEVDATPMGETWEVAIPVSRSTYAFWTTTYRNWLDNEVMETQGKLEIVNRTDRPAKLRLKATNPDPIETLEGMDLQWVRFSSNSFTAELTLEPGQRLEGVLKSRLIRR